MLTTESHSPDYDVSNIDMAEIGDFKHLVKSASAAAAALPLADLPKAFQLSFGLIEKVSDLMLSAFIPNKKESSLCPQALHQPTSTKHTNSIKNDQVDNTILFDELETNRDFLKTSLRSVVRNKTPETQSSERDITPLDAGDEKSVGLKIQSTDGLEASDSEVHEDFEHRPRSVHSSVSSLLSTSERQHHQDTYLNEEIGRKSPSAVDESTATRVVKCGGSTKLEGADNTDRVTDTTESLQISAETTLQKSHGSYSSTFIHTRTPSAREYGQGLRSSADLRRWRLTSTDRLNTLIDECERQINGRKLYVCKFCGKVYEIKSSMRYHMKIIHLQMHLRTTEMQCRICGKQFTCVSAVNRHQSKCVLSTYPDNSVHRNKSYSFNLSGSAGGHTDTKGNTCSSTFGTTEVMNIGGKLNPASTNEQSLLASRQNNASSSVFHNLGLTSTPITTVLSETTYSTGSKGIIHHDSIGMVEPHTPATGNTNCCFSPTCHARPFNSLNSLPSELNVDPYWTASSTSIPWPTFPNLGYNLSEMTPVQLEMCMKAVVRGLHSNLTGNNPTSPMAVAESPTIMSKSNISPSINSAELASTSDAHRSSFSSTYTNTSSEISEAEPSFSSTKSDEVAIDLSARSHPDTIMIESF
ncbi:unnamed protein product [Echinostoma caproni]|uniref:C2H2-type domain-containing protein n=1 Tax=Echinostoma caproni TaxID=27848 RepID=A0A183AW87_9TREM|nr:unnamed protein product [Echinostoma caproni]